MVQAAMDNDAIIATAMDYFEGWFDGNAGRVERALHPDMDKRGVHVEATGAQLSDSRSAQQMVGWARAGKGQAERPADLAIKVRVDDVYGQIATATVYSAVYTEYLQLMRTAEGWRIVNTLFMRRNG